MRVGILRPDRLGDTVVSLPMAGWIRRTRPGVRVVWITRSPWKELLEGHPWVDEVAVVSRTVPAMGEMVDLLRSLHLDALLFAYSKPRWALAAWVARIPERVGPFRLYGLGTFTRRVRWSRTTHMVERGKRLVAGWLGEALQGELLPLLPVDPDLLRRAREKLPPSPRVVLHPSTGGTARTWPPDRFVALARRLEGEGIRVLWTGAVPVLDPPVGVDLQGKLGLRELVAVLSAVDGVVVGATGVFHLAWALHRPVVALMDRAHPDHVAMWGSLHPATRHLPLSGETPAVEEVWQALQDLWRSGRREGGGGTSAG